MPTFCRHNRLIQNCPICSREQAIEGRPLISTSAPRSSLPREGRSSRAGGGSGGDGTGTARGSGAARRGSGGGSSTGLRVKRLVRSADDGYRCGLVPGLKSSDDAARLAEEIAFAWARLDLLAADPPGLFAEVAAAGDLEERTWLAFLIAFIGPLDSDDPFASIRAARVSWASGELPALAGVEPGPRGALDPARGSDTVEAYRAWAARAGSQEAAFTGDAAWTPERRFERVFERLALPGLHRDARFELLVTLGTLGLYPMAAATLRLSGDNDVTVAAKRAFGIGDSMLLDRRAATLAEACGAPLAALDLGLYNWGCSRRVAGGVPPTLDLAGLESVRDALGL